MGRDGVHFFRGGVSTLPMLNRYFEGLKYWETDEEFTQAFQTACRFELKSSEERKMRRFLWEYREPMTPIRFFWFLKACRLGLVSVDILCKAVMEYLDITYCLDALCQFMKGTACGRRSTGERWNCWGRRSTRR